MTPTGVLLGFLIPYKQRSDITGSSIMALMQQDIKNFNTNEAIARVKDKDNMKKYGIPLVVGVAGKEIVKATVTGKGKKYALLGTDLALGWGIGSLAKTILDPPDVIPNTTPVLQAPQQNMVFDRPVGNPYELQGWR